MAKKPDHANWIAMKPKIKAAFAQLRKAGITAKMNFSISISNGISEIYDPKFRGYAFWHEQDHERVRTEGVVVLAFGVFANSTDDAIVALGGEVRTALEAQGLFVDWSDDPGARIEVHLKGRKKKKAVAKPPAKAAVKDVAVAKGPFVVGHEFRDIKLDGSVHDIDLSNDGKFLAVAVHKGPCIRVFTTADGMCVGEFAQKAWAGFGVTFIEGGKALCYLTRTEDHKATLWRVALPSGKPEKLKTLSHRCKGIDRDAQGTIVAIGGDAVLVFDVKKSKELWRVACNAPGAEGCTYFADAKRVWVFSSELSKLVLYDVASGKPLKKLDAPELGLQVVGSPDGRWLAGVGAGGRGVALYDLKTDKRITADAEGDLEINDTRKFSGTVAFSPDSKRMVFLTPNVISLTLPDRALEFSDTSIAEPGDLAQRASIALDAPHVAFSFYRGCKVVLVRTKSAS